jgi:hypothetical protein
VSGDWLRPAPTSLRQCFGSGCRRNWGSITARWPSRDRRTGRFRPRVTRGRPLEDQDAQNLTGTPNRVRAPLPSEVPVSVELQRVFNAVERERADRARRRMISRRRPARTAASECARSRDAVNSVRERRRLRSISSAPNRCRQCGAPDPGAQPPPRSLRFRQSRPLSRTSEEATFRGPSGELVAVRELQLAQDRRDVALHSLG